MKRVTWAQILGRPTWAWGNVQTVTPDLTVLMDTGDVVDIGSSLVGGLVVGDRVYVQSDGLARVVTGKNYTY